MTASPAIAGYENPAFNRGMGAMSHRDYDGAVQYFGEAIGFNDTDPKNYLMRGKAFFSMNNWELAIQDFNKSIQYAPNDSEAYLWRGTAHANLGKDDFAVKDYEQAIKLDPKLADKFFAPGQENQATHSQGEVINRRGRRQIVQGNGTFETNAKNGNAIRDYKQAMARVYPGRAGEEHQAVNQGDDSVGDETAGSGGGGGQRPGARRRVQALQSNPSADMHTDPLNNADVSSDQSLRKRRNERVVNSLDTDPNRGEFGPVPGAMELHGNPQKVLANMNDAIANDKSNAQNFFRRAKAYQKLQNPTSAMTDYDEAIRLDPNQARFYVGRASLFHQLSKPALVQADIERARRCDPDLPDKIRFQGEPYPPAVQRSASIPDRN
jgi:tetratricopeptide (TPR) repeat protein